MGELVVREARLPDDAAGLARVYISSAEHHAGLRPDLYRVPRPDAVAAHFREASRRPSAGVLLVAEYAGTIVGFVDIERANPVAEYSMMVDVSSVTLGIAVLAEYRGDGVGSTLMATAEAAAVRLGAGRIVLDMLADNDAARRFYERHGYAVTGLLMTNTVGHRPGPAVDDRAGPVPGGPRCPGPAGCWPTTST